MITAFRLVKEKYADIEKAFSGEGARKYPGRWHKRGEEVVYLAESIALAALEAFVHLGINDHNLGYVVFRCQIEDVEEIREVNNLPDDWRAQPPPASTQTIGSKWYQNESTALLKVPSVIIPTEFNYVLRVNSEAIDSAEINGPTEFHFDPRMRKTL